MEFNPNTIYEDFLNNRLDKITLIKQLTSIIENHDNNRIRANSIKILNELISKPLKQEKEITYSGEMVLSKISD